MSSVDVVVPCYRYGHYLRDCVHSILTQSLSDVRVLIIDDDSPDATAEIAEELCKEDSRVSFIKHKANIGHIATYNEGIAWATNDYFLILSADDYLLPEALGRATRLLDSEPDIAFTFGRVLVKRGEELLPDPLSGNGASATGWRVFGGSEFIKYSGARVIVPTPTAIVRTKVQKKVGGYRAELPHTADMEMWLRLAAHGTVGMIGAHQAVYRRHSDNMSLSYTSQTWLPDLRQRRVAFEYFFQDFGFMLESPKELQRELVYLLSCDALSLASTAFNNGKLQTCEELVEFALSNSPDVKTSATWRKLSCKRAVGYSAWNLIATAISWIRKTQPSG